MKTLRTALRAPQRAFTLIEMMVVIALLGIIAMLAAPSFTEIIGMQRLRAINNQLVTDFQYLRGEAVSRNQFLGFLARSESSESMSCYVIFSNNANPLNPDNLLPGFPGPGNPTPCNCTNAIGAACPTGFTDIRTVQIPRDLSIDLRFPPTQGTAAVASPITGGVARPSNSAASPDLEFCVEVRRTPRGRLRTGVNLSGRTTTCSPDGSVPGVPICPAYDATLGNCQAAS